MILDAGCNNTCHGCRWMEKFINYMGMQPELLPAEGRFKGVGGKVEVGGKRTIPVCLNNVIYLCVSPKTMSRGQRKMIEESLDDVEKEDCALRRSQAAKEDVAQGMQMLLEGYCLLALQH